MSVRIRGSRASSMRVGDGVFTGGDHFRQLGQTVAASRGSVSSSADCSALRCSGRWRLRPALALGLAMSEERAALSLGPRQQPSQSALNHRRRETATKARRRPRPARAARAGAAKREAAQAQTTTDVRRYLGWDESGANRCRQRGRAVAAGRSGFRAGKRAAGIRRTRL